VLVGVGRGQPLQCGLHRLAKRISIVWNQWFRDGDVIFPAMYPRV
jgi:hypothetical protein